MRLLAALLFRWSGMREYLAKEIDTITGIRRLDMELTRTALENARQINRALCERLRQAVYERSVN